MLNISFYLHWVVYSSAQAQFRLQSYEFFFETSAVVGKVNEWRGQKSDTPRLKMVVVAINML